MLMPKRVKRRKQHRGRMKGIATKGNAVAYGSYGLMADGRGWIDSKQIEAARGQDPSKEAVRFTSRSSRISR